MTKYPFLELENLSGINFNFSEKTDVLQVCEGAKLHLVSGIKGKKLYVVADKLQAKKAASELVKYGNRVVTATSRDDVLLYRKNYSKEQDGLNAINLVKIVKGDYDVIVASADMLGERVCNFSDFSEYIIELEKGKNYILYLPDTPLDGLSEEFLMWWPGRYDMQEQERTTLGYYGLYNQDMEYGFFGEIE